MVTSEIFKPDHSKTEMERRILGNQYKTQPPDLKDSHGIVPMQKRKGQCLASDVGWSVERNKS